MIMKKHLNIFCWLTAFSISMGFLETAVVVDLRELYYPSGFNFPLMPITPRIAITEFLREAATIIMLIGVGAMAGRTRVEKFAAFLYSFAIWDLFYYVFLKLLLDWPESLFTWDILFLIPVPWVGPVLAPCLISCSMILLAYVMVSAESRGAAASLDRKEKWGLIFGCLIVLVSFMLDYCRHISSTGGANWKPGADQQMFAEAVPYIPAHYDWWMFILGQGFILMIITSYYLKRRFS